MNFIWLQYVLMKLFSPKRSNILYFGLDEAGDIILLSTDSRYNYEAPEEYSVMAQVEMNIPDEEFFDWLHGQRIMNKKQSNYAITYAVDCFGVVEFDIGSFQKVNLT